MLRYLRSDATPLSPEDIQDIIKAKNSMKRASEAMANKYKISTRRVYQIWRGVHPPTDPKDMFSIPKFPDSDQVRSGSLDTDLLQPHYIESNIILGSKAKKTGGKKPKSKSAGISELSIIQNQLTPESSEILNISKEDLNAFYEKEAIRDEKIKQK
ncbi:11381_t:CDS:1 [Dentiscutata erythropus]|uniref:11381_t:CDS:1 n=1 Tax=Dentiscutata erythropus TaxID=1348616 RepID=A0A9N9IEA1_9GLOM|nr:11381_t:CDS:1 [Dentiscutata erythropus]